MRPTLNIQYDDYPFGSLMPGRSYNANGYRFGFNGQEKDDEVFGSTGTSYTAEFWQYDSRIGRRWNIDPVVKPWESSYATFSGNPIWFSDPNGLDTVSVNTNTPLKSGDFVDFGDGNILPVPGQADVEAKRNESWSAKALRFLKEIFPTDGGFNHTGEEAKGSNNSDRKGNPSSHKDGDVGLVLGAQPSIGIVNAVNSTWSITLKYVNKAKNILQGLVGTTDNVLKLTNSSEIESKIKEKHYDIHLDGRKPFQVVGNDTIFEKEATYGNEIRRNENGKEKNDTIWVLYPYQHGN